MNTEEREIFPSGATSTKAPRFDLVPFRPLFKLCARFSLGEVRHALGCWNARKNPQYLLDRDFVRARINHVIKHSFLLLAKLDGLIPDDGDDDAAAIAWGGVFLSEAMDALHAEQLKKPTTITRSKKRISEK